MSSGTLQEPSLRDRIYAKIWFEVPELSHQQWQANLLSPGSAAAPIVGSVLPAIVSALGWRFARRRPLGRALPHAQASTLYGS
jgi:hypothetical protein